MASDTTTPGGSGPIYGDDEMAQEHAGGAVPPNLEGRGAALGADPKNKKSYRSSRRQHTRFSANTRGGRKQPSDDPPHTVSRAQHRLPVGGASRRLTTQEEEPISEEPPNKGSKHKLGQEIQTRMQQATRQHIR